MGCDIHLYVEKFDGKKWVHIQEDVMENDDVPIELSFFDTRSYSLFAILANVRNNGNFNPISEPKGLPEDCSESIRNVQDWRDGHSHSWLTLKEIFEFDWTQSVKREGWMKAWEYHTWNERCYVKEGGENPYQWCGGVGGGAVVHVSEKEMKKLVKDPNPAAKNAWSENKKRIEELYPHHYCLVEWEVPYFRCEGGFWSECIPRLLRLGTPENVRIVFWFDS